jgi:hypothetical protein
MNNLEKIGEIQGTIPFYVLTDISKIKAKSKQGTIYEVPILKAQVRGIHIKKRDCTTIGIVIKAQKKDEKKWVIQNRINVSIDQVKLLQQYFPTSHNEDFYYLKINDLERNRDYENRKIGIIIEDDTETELEIKLEYHCTLTSP